MASEEDKITYKEVKETDVKKQWKETDPGAEGKGEWSPWSLRPHLGESALSVRGALETYDSSQRLGNSAAGVTGDLVLVRM